jgi:hypothetical protein
MLFVFSLAVEADSVFWGVALRRKRQATEQAQLKSHGNLHNTDFTPERPQTPYHSSPKTGTILADLNTSDKKDNNPYTIQAPNQELF